MAENLEPSACVMQPSVYPMHRCKVVHIVRHGEGHHNVAGERDKSAYESPEFFDASLTTLGWEQALSLREHNTRMHVTPQLVVVSPLTRTMQTAVGAFGGGQMMDGEPLSHALMADGVGVTQHPAISSSGAPPFIAVEWCREHIGLHPCDKRQPISVYRTLFPAIDFSEVHTDEDTWWQADHRETDDELNARCRIFVQWLLNREEKRIAVVTHSSFIWHMLRLFGEDCSLVVRKEMYEGYTNCEMRSVVIADRKATGPAANRMTDFAGGSVRYVGEPAS